MLITNGLLWKPARSEKNLAVAILYRLHKDPFVGVDMKAKAASHDIARSLIMQVLAPGSTEPESLEEALSHMPAPKRERIRRAYALLLEGELPARKKVHPKVDETISAKAIDEGENPTIKVRAIMSVDALSHAMALPSARMVAKELKAQFDGERLFSIQFKGATVLVRIVYASSLDQKGLDRLGDLLMGDDIVFAVAGDDMAISWGVLAKKVGGRFAEWDYSMFDQTQDKVRLGQLKRLCYIWECRRTS